MASRCIQLGFDPRFAARVSFAYPESHYQMLIFGVYSGHSQPRTHRGHDAKFPGMAITYALMQRLEELAETEPERVQIIKKARVTSINKEGNLVTGVSYEYNGEAATLD